MQKVKALFYVAKQSLISTEYYADILKVPLKFSTSYYVALGIFAAIIIAMGGTIYITPEIRSETRQFLNVITNAYPDDLNITFSEESVSVNRPQPYLLHVPEEYRHLTERENIFVIDSEGTINDLDTYNSYAIINDKNIIIDDQTTIRPIPLTEFPKGTLDKTKIVQATQEFEKFTKLIPFIVFIAFFSLYVLYFVLVRTFVVLVLSLMLTLYGKSRGLALPTAKYFQISLHAVTLPFIVEIIAATLNVVIPLPMWFFILSLVIGMVVVHSITEESIREAQQAILKEIEKD